MFKLLCNVSLCFSDQQKIQNEVGSIPYEAVSRDGDDRTQEWNPGAPPVIYHFFPVFRSGSRLLLNSDPVRIQVQMQTIDKDIL